MRKGFLALAVCVLMMTATHVWAELIPDTGHPDDRVCNPRSFTNLGNGIIRDNVTGLEWLQETSPTQLTWFAAFTYCEGTFAGLSDWRLPTATELETLVDHGRYDPAITPLFDIPAKDADEEPDILYWTGDAYQNNPGTGSAWYVNFTTGWVNYEYNTETNYVRPVRGASYGSLNNFIVNGDGTVTDTITGLMWQQCSYGQTWNGAQCKGPAKPPWWNLAVEYINDLKADSSLGYDDWRLPTRNELQSLVDYSSYNPATTFPDTEGAFYWSSTPFVIYSDYIAWGVGFFNGYVSTYDKEGGLLVRAVRGGLCFGCFVNDDCGDGRLCVDGQCACQNDTHCDDSVTCNGDETCDSGACTPGTTTCAEGEYCYEAADQCVECLNNSQCDTMEKCDGNICVPRGDIQIDKSTVKAGKTDNTDSIQLSGLLDATEDDFNAALGGEIVVSIEAAYIPDLSATKFTFPIEEDYLNNGKYTSPKFKSADKTAPVTSFACDTTAGTMQFSAKNLDLTGLSCPITFKVTIGDYVAEVQIDEKIVNGPKKPCPLPLLMGVYDSLDVTKEKAKKSTKTDSDSVSLSGTFTIDGSFDTAQPVIIKIGNDTFTISGNAFVAKNGSYSCKSYDSGNGLVTAKFDTVKCTFSIKIKNTTLSDSGSVDFEIDLFGNALQASTQISLPPDP